MGVASEVISGRVGLGWLSVGGRTGGIPPLCIEDPLDSAETIVESFYQGGK